MTRIGRLIGPLLLLAAPALAADGVWTLRERFCMTVDGRKQCSRGTEDLMLLGGTAYYRPDAGDFWTEIGTVTTNGKSFLVRVSRQGVGRLVANRAGIDVSDMLRDFLFTYKGRIAGTRIVGGRANVNFVIDVGGDTHHVRGNAAFTGRRIGDAYPVPPPDPYYYGEATAAPARRRAPAAFSAVRSVVSRTAGWDVRP